MGFFNFIFDFCERNRARTRPYFSLFQANFVIRCLTNVTHELIITLIDVSGSTIIIIISCLNEDDESSHGSCSHGSRADMLTISANEFLVKCIGPVNISVMVVNLRLMNKSDPAIY